LSFELLHTVLGKQESGGVLALKKQWYFYVLLEIFELWCKNIT